MTSGSPTGSLLDISESSVIDSANHQGIGPVFGEVALQTQVRVADFQHLVVGTPVHIMTSDTSFPHGLVFESVRSGFSWMTFGTRAAFLSKNTLGE